MQRIVDVIVKVIVIGAGISGTGASLQLTNSNIEHVILQGRDRVGGRIVAGVFDGVSVELGAAFVHQTDQDNRIADMIRQEGWGYTFPNQADDQYFYQNGEQLDDRAITAGEALYERVCDSITQKLANSITDLSLEQAAGSYYQMMKNTRQEVKDAARWNLNMLGNVEGAELREISAKSCEGESEQNDILPKGGYSKLYQHIFNKTRPQEVKYNQRVIKINYSSDIVKVYTQNNVYLANKVISSLPLGVLKSNSVQFVPPLPETHQEAIKKIGNGVLNKIYISFQSAFWDKGTKWVNFITKDNYLKYPAAFAIEQQGKHILCVFVSGDASKQMSELSDEQIQNDFITFLRKFLPNEDLSIKAFKVTRWDKDPFSLGSYSYNKVGTTPNDYSSLRNPIDDKIWFVGQHCHPKLASYTHGAFETGIWAAQEIAASLK